MPDTEGVKISLLPSATTPADADVLAGVQGNTTKKFSLSALKAFFMAAVTPPKVGSVSLSASWSGAGPYSQTVTVTGATVTANSKVDIQLTAAQIASLIAAGVTGMVIENNAGTLTAWAVGASPSAMTVQVTVTEVE